MFYDFRLRALVAINPSNGTTRVIGSMGLDFVAGLALATNGTVLGTTGGFESQHGGEDSQPGALVSIDTKNGKATVIDLTGFIPVSGITKLP